MFLALQGQQAEDTFVQPLQNALSTFLSYLPQLVGAIIILIIGYIVAKVLQAVVTRGCYELNQERLRNAENGGLRGTEPTGESASQCGFHPSS